MTRRLPLLLALLLAVPASAQDLEDGGPLDDVEGLGGPGASLRGAAADFPPLDDPAPLLGPRFTLSGDWRVDGVDAQAGPYAGTIHFSRLGPARFRYERRVGARGQAPTLVEQGEARIIGGRLYTLARQPSTTLGLERALAPTSLAPGQVAPRRAILALDADGVRLEGIWRAGARRGVERLRPDGWAAADNRVQLLVDGGEAFSAFRQALAAATRSIELQTFIFTDDPTGRSIKDLLVARARAGVKVRLLVDAIGDNMKKLDDELEAAGCEVIKQHGVLAGLGGSLGDLGRGVWSAIKRLFGGASAPEPREKRGIFNHDHRKILIVDGRVGFCGGMNMAAEYEHDWHDVHARVEGSAVPRLRILFYDRWRAAGGKGEPPPAVEGGASPGDLSVDVVSALPGVSQEIKQRYLQEIGRARARVLIENAYFLDDAVLAAMRNAAARRVRTVLILPGDEVHDVKIVRDAFATVQNDVVRSGIELYKFDGRMVHSKVAAFDGRVATVGSSNLDAMALERLAEANLFVNDRRFTAHLEQRVFAADLQRVRRCSEEELTWWQQVKGKTLFFFRSFL